jgi:hypothetical protein
VRPSEGRNEKWRILEVFAILNDEPVRSVATKFLKIEFLEVTFGQKNLSETSKGGIFWNFRGGPFVKSSVND